MKKAIAILLIFTLFIGTFFLPVKAAAMDSHAGAVTTSSGPLNVRASASSGSAVLTSLKKGSYITLLSKSGSWWRVEYAKGKYGFIGKVTDLENAAILVKVQVKENVE